MDMAEQTNTQVSAKNVCTSCGCELEGAEASASKPAVCMWCLPQKRRGGGRSASRGSGGIGALKQYLSMAAILAAAAAIYWFVWNSSSKSGTSAYAHHRDGDR